MPTVRERVERTMQLEIDKWPAHYARAANAEHLGFRSEKHNSGVGRHAFFLFCIHNGCRPELLVQWLVERACLKRDAMSELTWALQKLGRGEPCGETWDLRQKRKVVAQMPVSNWEEVPLAVALLAAEAPSVSIEQSRPEAPSGCDAYYAHTFPYDDIARLLNRLGSPFLLREMVIDCDTLRGRPILDLQTLRDTVEYRKAASLHVGPAYHEGSQERRTDGPLGTELVLEIDELPEGMDEALRWKYMRHSVEVISKVAHFEFGIARVLCFASGNRGVHIWCLDDWILRQNSEERKLLFRKLQEPLKLSYWEKLADEVLLPFYNEIVQPETESLVDDAELARVTFPIFDQAVATQSGHLHRLPFSVHQKTGRIAVVIGSLDDVPTRLEDMPLANSPLLDTELRGPLAVLRLAAGWSMQTAADGRELLSIDAVIPVAQGAPWMKKRAEKRKRVSNDRTADHCTVSPLHIDLEATRNFASALETASAASSLGEIADLDIAAIARASEGKRDRRKPICKPDGWRDRLRREARSVKKLIEAVKLCNGELNGETYTKNGCGRTLTYYPQLDEWQFLQRLAKQTRHAMTGHRYYELDVSGAHLAVAWSAVVQQIGLTEAGRLCPSLQLATINKNEARRRVASQCRVTPTAAKRMILAALNQKENSRCSFLTALCDEREYMLRALRAHPLIVGEKLQAIQKQSSGNDVRELSLLMQTVEGAILRLTADTLRLHGYEVAALIADGLLCRRVAFLSTGLTSQQALSAAIAAVELHTREQLRVDITLEIEHTCGSD